MPLSPGRPAARTTQAYRAVHRRRLSILICQQVGLVAAHLAALPRLAVARLAARYKAEDGVHLGVPCQQAVVRYRVVQAWAEAAHLCLLTHQPNGCQLRQR